MTNGQFPKSLDAALKRVTQERPVDDAAVGRVVSRLAPPLPRQKASLWRLPAVLLDWQFAPAWPRVTALAACAVLGFYVGIAGLDRPYDNLDGSFTIASSNGDLGSIVFEPETLTGARP
jgi:hypothetical protein